MTTRKTFKTRVRARMAKTGERYAAALRNLEPPEVAGPSEAAKPSAESQEATPASGRHAPAGPLTSEGAVRAATGRGWDEWFALLDAHGALEMRHPEIAGWLVREQGIPGWWAQNVTVGYERARGLRAAHQTSSGFQVGVSRTVGVPLERLYTAFVDEDVRATWTPPAGELRWATEHKGARLDCEDGSRVIVSFTAKGPDRSVISLSHERLADAGMVEERRALWRAALDRLKSVLETGSAPA